MFGCWYMDVVVFGAVGFFERKKNDVVWCLFKFCCLRFFYILHRAFFNKIVTPLLRISMEDSEGILELNIWKCVFLIFTFM